jgi:heme/copper-type cytochrome/quinol oxidase subunit 3
MTAIPYTVERRSDTGINNVMLGMWLFLASEVMLFGGLFSAYVLLRSGATGWPRGADVLNVPLGGVNTVILLGTSAMFVMARRAALRQEIGRARALLAAIGALAFLFLAIKAFEYNAEIGQGIYPATSTFAAVYYLLTSIHALHIVGGAIANFYLAAAGLRSTGGDAARFANRLSACALYWYFVDVVWLCIFGSLYLA